MWLRLLLTALLFFIAAAPHAGERLSLDKQVARSDAVVELKVELASENTPDTITVVSMLTDPTGKIVASSEWFGLCLPSREILEQRWLHGHPDFTSAPIWRRSICEGGYQTVIFLRKDNGAFHPTCEAEAMLSKNWSTHSEHAQWRSRLFDLIDQSDHLKRSKDTPLESQ